MKQNRFISYFLSSYRDVSEAVYKRVHLNLIINIILIIAVIIFIATVPFASKNINDIIIFSVTACILGISVLFLKTGITSYQVI